MKWFFLVFTLLGCTDYNYQVGTTGILAVEGSWPYSQQECQSGDYALYYGDLAVTVIARHAHLIGVNYEAIRGSNIAICLVDKPEPCGELMSQGCASTTWMWAIRNDQAGKQWPTYLVILHELIHSIGRATEAYATDSTHSQPVHAILEPIAKATMSKYYAAEH